MAAVVAEWLALRTAIRNTRVQILVRLALKSYSKSVLIRN